MTGTEQSHFMNALKVCVQCCSSVVLYSTCQILTCSLWLHCNCECFVLLWRSSWTSCSQSERSEAWPHEKHSQATICSVYSVERKECIILFPNGARLLRHQTQMGQQDLPGERLWRHVLAKGKQLQECPELAYECIWPSLQWLIVPTLCPLLFPNVSLSFSLSLSPPCNNQACVWENSTSPAGLMYMIWFHTKSCVTLPRTLCFFLSFFFRQCTLQHRQGIFGLDWQSHPQTFWELWSVHSWRIENRPCVLQRLWSPISLCRLDLQLW